VSKYREIGTGKPGNLETRESVLVLVGKNQKSGTLIPVLVFGTRVTKAPVIFNNI
jgi:hypothetical protein